MLRKALIAALCICSTTLAQWSQLKDLEPTGGKIVLTESHNLWEPAMLDELARVCGHETIGGIWDTETIFDGRVARAKAQGAKLMALWSPYHKNDGTKPAIPGYVTDQIPMPIGIEPSLGHYLWMVNRANTIRGWLLAEDAFPLFAGNLLDNEVWHVNLKQNAVHLPTIESLQVTYASTLRSILPGGQHWYGACGWGGTKQNQPQYFHTVNAVNAMGNKQASIVDYSVSQCRGAEIASELASTYGSTASATWGRSVWITLTADYTDASKGWDVDACLPEDVVRTKINDLETNVAPTLWIVYVSSFDNDNPDIFAERLAWLVEEIAPEVPQE